VERYWIDAETDEVPSIDAQCITVLTTPDSFEGHRKFTKKETKHVVPEGKKRAVPVKKEYNRLYVGLMIVDEHERKGAGTGLIKLV
jgi:hypothetical protein